jgi:GNAT superfamily N-acetyltransferase
LIRPAVVADDGRMPTGNEVPGKIECRPVSEDNVADLERFSRQHGKFRYCSCMRWRMTSTEYKGSTKDDRIGELNRLAGGDTPVGVLGYVHDEPVGWCAVAPRGDYRALERFRALPRLDDQQVWSVVCFFVDRRVRRTGATRALLRAAVEYAQSQGARVIEGYPVELGPRLYTYMGSRATFRAAGFTDVTPAGQSRTVMRYTAES